MIIRRAAPEDAPQVCAIANHLVDTSTITFNSIRKTEEQISKLILEGPHPVFVAVEGNEILGYVSSVQFRGGSGYRFVAEHSIALKDSAKGKGAGRGLMQALEEGLQQIGITQLVAAVSADNAAGRAFHSAIGFKDVGYMPQVGHKFDGWLDLVLMQKDLRR